jgi:hypothetical protein
MELVVEIQVRVQRHAFEQEGHSGTLSRAATRGKMRW